MNKLILILLFHCFLTIQSQTSNRISGTVIDFEFNRLQNVSIKNLSNGNSAATDANGNFEIIAKNQDSIKFFYIGLMPTFKVIEKNEKAINLILVEDSYICFETEKFYARKKRRLKKYMNQLYIKAEEKGVWED